MEREKNERQTTHKRRPELDGVLTPREWELLDLQAQGLAYKEIAAKLGLAEQTVKNHLSHVRDKLGARNAIEAINKAYLQLG